MPRNNELGKLRRSQVITTYGPGAIVDFRAGGVGAPVSVVAGGLEQWDEFSSREGLEHTQVIYEPRLQRRLNVGGFRLPPVIPETAPGQPAPNGDHLAGFRFPEWLQCPQCDTINWASNWGKEPGNPARWCPQCTAKKHGRARVYAFPVRFITVCENGHLEEFPWHRWVEHKPGCTNKGALKLGSAGRAGLAGLRLECPQCKRGRSMEMALRQGELGLRCKGRRPWLSEDDTACDKPLRGSQRGASNLYFPILVSALDIPPWSHPIQKRLDSRWEELRAAPDDERPIVLNGVLRVEPYCSLLKDYERSEILAQVEEALKTLEEDASGDLRHAEYVQFVRAGGHGLGEAQEFEVRPQDVPAEVKPWVSSLVQATRLREVRALKAFTRVNPPAGPDDSDSGRLASLSVHRKHWLPAVEVRGEGIFVDLSGARLQKWEQEPVVVERVSLLQEAYVDEWARRHGDSPPPRSITPRLVLVHSLAHAIIRELSLSCGYSSASLRERLYVSDDPVNPMAGILVYTASADSDGTLGGLTRQGLTARFRDVILDGLRQQEWCSSDPLCITAVQSHTESLNGAACHACLMLPETSCEEFNRILDRALLVGLPDQPALGYFRDLLDDAKAW